MPTTHKVLSRHEDGTVVLCYSTTSKRAAEAKLYEAKFIANVAGHGKPFLRSEMT